MRAEKAQAEAPQPELNEYEAAQVREIAAWKAKTPGLVTRITGALAAPVGKLANRLMPQGAVNAAIEGLNKMAGSLTRDDSILKDSVLQAEGIHTFEQLGEKPLEFADALADRIIRDAGHIALGMGAATGTGGPVAAAAGLPVLLAGAMRVIYRVSQAYGFSIDQPGDKELMLHVLALSTANSAGERKRAMTSYQRQIETTFLRQAFEESAQKALQRAVLGAELGALVPGFSIAFNAYLNREFVNRAGETAKRVFQEHWLRERGKVRWIVPSKHV